MRPNCGTGTTASGPDQDQSELLSGGRFWVELCAWKYTLGSGFTVGFILCMRG